MENQKPQPITWQQLKEFVNSIPDDQINHTASILVEDSTYSKPLLEPFFMHVDIYSNKDDGEDSGSLEDLKYAHGDDFNVDDYELVTPKGTAFLWAE